jgi:hypothetical protein
VGAFTHGVAVSAEQAQELQSLVGTMIELKYLRSEEVPQIPHRSEAMQFAAYAPLGAAAFDRLVAAEHAKCGEVVRAANIRTD